MAATRKGLYNAALILISERQLATTTEDVESRRVLDEIWLRGRGLVHSVLEQGLWNFATRTSQFDASANITVTFGHPHGFEHPSDYVRLVGISSDEFFNNPLTGHGYTTEAGIWYASSDPIYVRYISNGVAYGGDFDLWPETFTRYVEAYLATAAAPRITKDSDLVKDLGKLEDKRLKNAKSKDAMDEGTEFMPEGSWRRARRGGGTGERGNRHRLIG